MSETRVRVEAGKYEFVMPGNGKIHVLRNGEPWIDDFVCPGDKAIMGLLYEHAALLAASRCPRCSGGDRRACSGCGRAF